MTINNKDEQQKEKRILILCVDRDGDIDTVDWPEFRDNFGKAPAADCLPGDLHQIYGP